MERNLYSEFQNCCDAFFDCANCPFDKEYQYCWKECQEEFRNLPLDEQIDKINEMAKNFEGSK